MLSWDIPLIRAPSGIVDGDCISASQSDRGSANADVEYARYRPPLGVQQTTVPPPELAECLRAAVSFKKLPDHAWHARICDKLAE